MMRVQASKGSSPSCPAGNGRLGDAALPELDPALLPASGRGRSPSCPPRIAPLPYESASLERPARRSGPTGNQPTHSIAPVTARRCAAT